MEYLKSKSLINILEISNEILEVSIFIIFSNIDKLNIEFKKWSIKKINSIFRKKILNIKSIFIKFRDIK